MRLDGESRGRSEDGGHYRRLEVGAEASRPEIVRAYRRLALGVHPDAHPEDAEAPRRFRELTEAYEVLSDPGRRAEYDRQRAAPRIAVRRRVNAAAGAPGHSAVIRLGPQRPERGRGVPLRVGPVRVTSPLGLEAERSALLALVSDILNSRWSR